MQIGLVGCGTLGCTLGLRLLRAGHSLRVHDRVPDHARVLLHAGAEWSDDPGSVAQASGLIVSALPRPEDVEEIFPGDAGVWSVAARHTIHVETSTVGLSSIRRLSRAAASSGVRFLDGPVSRGEIGGDRVSLVMWLGGSADFYDLARPVLEVLADRVVYCGGVGHGQVTKLLNNLIAHSLIVIVGEALTLGAKAGLTVDGMHAALHEGTGQTRLLDEVLPESVFRGDWQPGLSVALALKDLELAGSLAEEHGVKLSLLERLREQFDAAAKKGWEERSAHSVIRMLEEAAGVELRSGILEALEPPGEDSPGE